MVLSGQCETLELLERLRQVCVDVCKGVFLVFFRLLLPKLLGGVGGRNAASNKENLWI